MILFLSLISFSLFFNFQQYQLLRDFHLNPGTTAAVGGGGGLIGGPLAAAATGGGGGGNILNNHNSSNNNNNSSLHSRQHHQHQLIHGKEMLKMGAVTTNAHGHTGQQQQQQQEQQSIVVGLRTSTQYEYITGALPSFFCCAVSINA